ncbi:hypothetical protein NEHOM01_1208 [Nematocida homosporus]|uniref:uncharacterized protein n=1 Tax=Nematocida homosporus TaxID=1912981 RepID=UPI00221E44A8|nr:uncharacterized protein NEHOM01_1208 [Nematocida homosporus]KAI5185985.1 hypothetical protein NEHOM01_1208 [Nematocida homosporus]
MTLSRSHFILLLLSLLIQIPEHRGLNNTHLPTHSNPVYTCAPTRTNLKGPEDNVSYKLCTSPAGINLAFISDPDIDDTVIFSLNIRYPLAHEGTTDYHYVCWSVQAAIFVLQKEIAAKNRQNRQNRHQSPTNRPIIITYLTQKEDTLITITAPQAYTEFCLVELTKYFIDYGTSERDFIYATRRLIDENKEHTPYSIKQMLAIRRQLTGARITRSPLTKYNPRKFFMTNISYLTAQEVAKEYIPFQNISLVIYSQQSIKQIEELLMVSTSILWKSGVYNTNSSGFYRPPTIPHTCIPFPSRSKIIWYKADEQAVAEQPYISIHIPRNTPNSFTYQCMEEFIISLLSGENNESTIKHLLKSYILHSLFRGRTKTAHEEILELYFVIEQDFNLTLESIHSIINLFKQQINLAKEYATEDNYKRYLHNCKINPRALRQQTVPDNRFNSIEYIATHMHQYTLDELCCISFQDVPFDEYICNEIFADLQDSDHWLIFVMSHHLPAEEALQYERTFCVPFIEISKPSSTDKELDCISKFISPAPRTISLIQLVDLHHARQHNTPLDINAYITKVPRYQPTNGIYNVNRTYRTLSTIHNNIPLVISQRNCMYCDNANCNSDKCNCEKCNCQTNQQTTIHILLTIVDWEHRTSFIRTVGYLMEFAFLFTTKYKEQLIRNNSYIEYELESRNRLKLSFTSYPHYIRTIINTFFQEYTSTTRPIYIYNHKLTQINAWFHRLNTSPRDIYIYYNFFFNTTHKSIVIDNYLTTSRLFHSRDSKILKEAAISLLGYDNITMAELTTIANDISKYISPIPDPPLDTQFIKSNSISTQLTELETNSILTKLTESNPDLTPTTPTTTHFIQPEIYIYAPHTNIIVIYEVQHNTTLQCTLLTYILTYIFQLAQQQILLCYSTVSIQQLDLSSNTQKICCIFTTQLECHDSQVLLHSDIKRFNSTVKHIIAQQVTPETQSQIISYINNLLIQSIAISSLNAFANSLTRYFNLTNNNTITQHVLLNFLHQLGFYDFQCLIKQLEPTLATTIYIS